MRAEQENRSLWHFNQFVNKCDAFRGEAINHMLVVHNFVIDVDVRTEHPDALFQTFDGHVDAGTKAAWVRENNFHCTLSLMKQA